MKDLLYILSLLTLFSFHYHQQRRIDFLHAWNVVKKLRVDNLAKGICEEECKQQR